MTEKRFTFRVVRDDDGYDIIGFDIDDLDEESSYFVDTNERCVKSLVELLNALHEENEQLKKDVEYWKQVASQYSNELNVFEHCKKYKTECKDIYILE